MDQRFTLIRPLGEGGRGSVCLVGDRDREGMTVALKRLGERSGTTELAAEFDVLSRLRHPNLARAYDYGVDDEGAYFTSEFVSGKPILDWARSAPRDEVVRALAALLRVLALIHDRQIVHGDVTAENVLIATAPGKPAVLKLLDLGGACRPGEIGTGSTAGFAAPEILTGRGALPASDLYAFGALLSQVLLGVSPFGSGDASTVVRRQLSGENTLPEADLSPLAALAGELLSLDPSLRPKSALDTLEKLAAASETDLGISLEDVAADDLPAPRIVGREREISVLSSLLDHVDSDSGERVVVLNGPSGSGLSTLLEEIARRAQLACLEVVGEIHSPSRIGSLVDALVAKIDVMRLSQTSRNALGPWIEPGGARRTDPSSSWSASIGFAAVEALALACEETPLLLVVDDFSKSDRLVREVVTTLARSLSPQRMGRPRAAIVIVDTPPQEGVPRQVLGNDVSLAPLDSAGIADLVASMLPGVTWPAELNNNVILTSEGLPKVAEELVRQAVGPGGEAHLHDRVREMVGHLPATSRCLIAVLGRMDRSVHVDSILAVGLDKAKVVFLIQAGFLYESSGGGERYQAAALAARVARDETSEDAQVALAREMADVFANIGRLEEAAILWNISGDKKRSSSAYADLARQFLHRGNFTGAGEWFEKALRVGGDSTGALAKEALGVWRDIGWYEQALRVLPAAGFDEDTRFRLEAELTMENGHHPQALAIAVSVSKQSAQRFELGVVVAACELQLGHHERALAIALESLKEPGDTSTEMGMARLSQIAGLACTYLGRVEEAHGHFRQAKEGFVSANDRLGQLKVSANLGMLQRLKGDLAEARRSYDRAVELAREIGDRPREALHLMNRATVLQVICNYEAAFADYRSALDIATVLGNAFRITQVELNLSDLLLDMGDRREASRLAVSALERCRAMGQERLETRALLNAGQTALRSGDLVRAERRLMEARRRFSAAGDDAGRISANQQIAELYIARGDASSALDLASDIALETQKKGRWRENARANILVATGHLETGGDAAEALEALTRADHALKREPAPDFLWRLSLLRSRALRRRNQTAEASKALDKARFLFANLTEKVPEKFRTGFLECAATEEIRPTEGGDETTSSDRWSRDLEMLIEITQALTREREPKRLLSLIMESAVELTGAERGMVVMPRGDTLDQVISYEISDEIEKRFSRSVAEKVVREGRSVLAVDALDDERFRTFVSVNAMKLRSILAVPLKIKRRVIGAIYLDSRLRTGVFTDADHRLLEAFGAQAAIALETARLLSENTNRCADLKRANEEIQRLSDQLKEKLATNEIQLRRVGALLQKTQKDESERLIRSGIVGRSVAMQKVMRMVDRIALADVPVYIYGASGTGKELVARAVHSASERAENPFVPVNCGALPPKLLASELFGHKRGAFTGAVGDRPGLFRLADQGTLFLDEVSDMDKEMQTHLLRVLQDGTFRSLGDNEEVSVDVRILSASNRDLEEEVRAGRFREDLFYRLNVVRIDIPPLAERREDIPLLIDHLARRHAKGDPPSFSREAVDVLTGAEWLGNVRELENEVQRAITMAGSASRITLDDLSPRLTSNNAKELYSGKGTLKERVSHFEGVLIRRVLDTCDDNATKAAANLGISRATLYKKLERYGIDR